MPMGCECSPQSRGLSMDLPKRDYEKVVRSQVKDYPVLLYSSTQSPDSQEVRRLLRSLHIPFESFEVEYMRTLQTAEAQLVAKAVRVCTDRQQLPVLIVGGETVGGIREVRRAVESGELGARLREKGVEVGVGHNG